MKEESESWVADWVCPSLSSAVVAKAVMDAFIRGGRFTTLKDRKKEIGPGLLNAMLGQLGLAKDDLEE